MGIDIHALNLLKFASAKRNFGRVATIGRQGIHIRTAELKQALNLNEEPKFNPFCEDLLRKHFSATSVDSFDNSDYEQATHIADLNKPLTVDNRYDTVIDFGTTEHVYNISQALWNISNVCSPKGQILHALPANNFCGHGFWQFSPELFFSLYSSQNGYTETEVFIADVSNNYFWYKVSAPSGGNRAELNSSTPLYVLVRTVKTGAFSQTDVQQSDYTFAWKGDEVYDHSTHVLQSSTSRSSRYKLKTLLKESTFGPLIAEFYLRRLKRSSLSTLNTNFKKVPVSSLF
jgi:hypothetical protein